MLKAQSIPLPQGRASIVLLKNAGEIIPLKRLDTLSIRCSGEKTFEPFLQFLGRYTTISSLQQDANLQIVTRTQGWQNGEIRRVEGYNILCLFGDSVKITQEERDLYDAIFYISQNTQRMQDRLSQIIFGGIGAGDTLTHEVGPFEEGEGLTSAGHLRFSFTSPREAGLDSAYLTRKLDSIALHAIDSGVAPGIQVLVAKDGKVCFHKTYGYIRYDSLTPVRKEDLYDFASLTKVTGALPGLMRLYDERKFSLEATLGTYLPYFKHGNKKYLQFREVLAHNARLKAWIPYWTTTIKKNGKYKRHTLSHDSSAVYPTKIVDGLYLYKDYRREIYKQIRKSRLNKDPGYVYSGLSFYLYPEIITKLSGEDYENYLKDTFYRPLGATTITFNPLRYFPKDRIIPTEVDTFFRMTPLWGTVHDEGAAMMKGVSGNAGLFGTALDLAKVFQMYLWMGSYGGERYISRSTLELFTTCQYCNEDNRRGLGFDKPLIDHREDGSIAVDASDRSFGHSGYTGTMAWADPDTGILFIFMSNRVYPTRLNRKLYQLNVRPAMHQAIYDARLKER